MLLLLYKDGTRGYAKDETSIPRKEDVEYYLISTKNPQTGNTFICIHADDFFDVKKIKIHALISYQDVFDMEAEEFNSFQQMDIETDSPTIMYKAFAAIQRKASLNNFIFDAAFEDTGVFINTLDIHTKGCRTVFHGTDEILNIDDEDIFGPHYVDKLFKKHGLRASTKDLLKGKFDFLIIDKGLWKISTKIPEDFDFIGIRVRGTQEMYILTWAEYQFFTDLSRIDIGMSYGVKEKNIPINPERDEDEFLHYEANINLVSDLCYEAYHISQLANLDFTDVEFYIKFYICLNKKNRKYERYLIFDDKEKLSMFNLFDAIYRLYNVREELE